MLDSTGVIDGARVKRSDVEFEVSQYYIIIPIKVSDHRCKHINAKPLTRPHVSARQPRHAHVKMSSSIRRIP